MLIGLVNLDFEAFSLTKLAVYARVVGVPIWIAFRIGENGPNFLGGKGQVDMSVDFDTRWPFDRFGLGKCCSEQNGNDECCCFEHGILHW